MATKKPKKSRTTANRRARKRAGATPRTRTGPFGEEIPDPLPPMLEYLAARGVDERCAERARLHPLDVVETRKLASRMAWGRSSFKVPHPDLDGKDLPYLHLNFAGQEAVDFEPTKDHKKPLKIWQEAGVAPPAYLPPPPTGSRRTWREVANDPGEPITITEGPVKALSASHRGMWTVAVAGVENWHVKDNADRLVDGLDDFTWNARHVDIVFDSDAATNKNVLAAEQKLRDVLERRGAFVTIVRLPPGAGGDKQGLDDYLVREGVDEYRKLRAALAWLPDTLDDGATLLDTRFPPLEFAVDPYLPRAELTEVHGPHGQFKSTLMLYACLCVATGERWGGHPTKQGRAVFISLEDKARTLQRRVLAWLRGGARGAGLERAVRTRFAYLGRERAAQMALTEASYGQTLTRGAVVERIAKLCAGASLVVLETTSRLHPVGETNETLAVFAAALEEIAEKTGAAVALVRHVSKEAARTGTTDSYGGRGGGALADAARSVLSIERRSDDPLSPVFLVHTKATHSRRGPDLAWKITTLGDDVLLKTATEADLASATENKWLIAIVAAGPDGIARRELVRSLPAKDRERRVEELDGAISALLKKKLIVAEKEEKSGPGRRPELLKGAQFAATGGRRAGRAEPASHR